MPERREFQGERCSSSLRKLFCSNPTQLYQVITTCTTTTLQSSDEAHEYAVLYSITLQSYLDILKTSMVQWPKWSFVGKGLCAQRMWNR